jgi:multiple sugar transport system ATP-binding protein
MNLVAGSLDADGRLRIGGAGLDWPAPAGAQPGAVTDGIRPEHLVADPQGAIQGEVILVERLGAESYVHLAVAGLAKPLMVVVKGEPPAANAAWRVSPTTGRVHVFDQGGLRIEPGNVNNMAAGVTGATEAA